MQLFNVLLGEIWLYIYIYNFKFFNILLKFFLYFVIFIILVGKECHNKNINQKLQFTIINEISYLTNKIKRMWRMVNKNSECRQKRVNRKNSIQYNIYIIQSGSHILPICIGLTFAWRCIKYYIQNIFLSKRKFSHIFP